MDFGEVDVLLCPFVYFVLHTSPKDIAAHRLIEDVEEGSMRYDENTCLAVEPEI